MTTIRILVGTRKGAFILTSDGQRKKWSIDGPHFAGWEIYHVKGSTVDPDRIYASQTSSWFGQIIQRSDDGGKSWSQPGSDGAAEKAAAAGMPRCPRFSSAPDPRAGRLSRDPRPRVAAPAWARAWREHLFFPGSPGRRVF